MVDIIFITGAAKGIGRATSVYFAKRGYGLFLCDWDEVALNRTVSECKKSVQYVESISIDIKEDGEVERALELFKEKYSSDGFRLKCLINNAGVGGWYRLDQLPVEKWDEIVGVNLRGTFLVTKSVIPVLKKQSYGTIITVASDSAEFAFPTRTAYCASKHGLVGFSNSVREELREWGIRVSVLYVSRVDTHFNGNVPGKRPDILRPEDVAETLGFIVSSPDMMEVREIKLTSIKSSYGLYR